MLSIQEIGLSIMGDSPKNLYFLGGTEYGIKEKYIDILEGKVGSKVEYSSILDIIALMRKHHIIPLEPHVYVVRYDKVFLTKLSKELSDTVLNTHIIGTIVALYEEDSAVSKLDKFFPNNIGVINTIDSKHMAKYIKSDFPDLAEDVIYSIAKNATDYFQAKNIARCVNCLDDAINLNEQSICSLFGLSSPATNTAIQQSIADRNYGAFVYLIDNYDGDVTSIFYLIMNTMVEFDKVLDNKYANSPVKEYANKWTRPDVFYMFNHTFNALESIRKGSTVDPYDMLLYLGALWKFKNIPDLEVLK